MHRSVLIYSFHFCIAIANLLKTSWKPSLTHPSHRIALDWFGLDCIITSVRSTGSKSLLPPGMMNKHQFNAVSPSKHSLSVSMADGQADRQPNGQTKFAD